MRQKRIHYILIVLGFLMVGVASGQQQPLFGHYMFNPYYLNPGAAGSFERVNTNLYLRNQWVGIKGAPVTYGFNVNAPFNLFGAQHGFGVSAIQDSYGYNTDMGMKLGYTFRFPVGTGKLGIGFQGGFITQSLKESEFIWGDENTGFAPSIMQINNFENAFAMDLDIGFFYKTDELFLGFSSMRVNNPDIEPRELSSVKIPQERHYYLMSGYNIYLPNPSFEVRPSFLLRSDGRIVNFDASMLLMYNKKFWGGMSYRNETTSYAVLFFGLELIKDLNIGYSYDIPSAKVINYTQQTHEFLINYNFTLTKDKAVQQYKSIRYL